MAKESEMSEKKICFVIAPIGEEGSETRERSDQILEFIIEPAATECGYERAERADSSPKPGMITSQIIEQLLDAPLVIADLTDHNPNVFYELAVRHAARKPVVQLIDREQKIPFDVGPMRTVYITHRDLALAHKAKKELIEHIKAAEVEPPDNPISTTVELRGLRQSGRSSEQVVAEILETVQRIERQLQDERASETALQRILGDPGTRAQPRAGLLDLIGEFPYTRIRREPPIGEYSERETPPTDVTGGPKST
jgi:hypothetical protein